VARCVLHAFEPHIRASSPIVTFPPIAHLDYVCTRAASETGAAASQVLGAASALSKQSEALRTEVDRFLAEVRAA
jgi:hypothetical protein